MKVACGRGGGGCGGGGGERERGTMRGSVWVCSSGASWAGGMVGVMGDTGGRLGETEPERLVEASVDEAGGGVVSTSRAGMAACGGKAMPGLYQCSR